MSTNNEDTNTNDSGLIFMCSKYQHLLNEYTKIFNPLYNRKTDMHKKASESGLKCIKCNHCNSTFEMDSSLKVHINLLHKSDTTVSEGFSLKCFAIFSRQDNVNQKFETHPVKSY